MPSGAVGRGQEAVGVAYGWENNRVKSLSTSKASRELEVEAGAGAGAGAEAESEAD